MIVTGTANPALDMTFEVDRVTPEHKLRCTEPVLHPGGGGINVARVASRLGADVRALWLGGGADGQRLADLLAREGVRHRCVPARDEPRRSLHVEERATGAMYRFVMPGPRFSQQDGEQLSEYVESCKGASYVVLSGSLPPSFSTGYYAQLAARVPATCRVILDTSGDALVRGLAGHVYLTKPNRNELARVVGRELPTLDDVVRAARELIEAGRVEVVAVSLAADGLVYVTRETHEHIAAPDVAMVSAVGAGDSAVAGIVVGLARGLALGDAMRLGVAAGSATVLSPGTELCRPEDVERLHAELQMRRPGARAALGRP